MKTVLHIQCASPNGETGTFLANREKGKPLHSGALQSPVFADLVALSEWARANGWAAMAHDPDWPTGVYTRSPSPQGATASPISIVPERDEFLSVRPAWAAPDETRFVHCEEDDAEIWAVYGPDGLIDDFPSRADAERFVSTLCPA